MIDAIAIDSLLQQCATGVAPSTMMAIIKVESGGNPLAIGDNTTGKRVSPTPRNADEAAAIALELLRQGHNLDLGLAQINSSNLSAYRVSVREVFDPCINVAVGSNILSTFYFKSVQKYGYGEVSLFHALSAYNTGSFFKGPNYVSRILAAAGSKANISSVAWKQPPSKLTGSKKNQQLIFKPFNSPIIALNNPNASSSNPDSINGIIALR